MKKMMLCLILGACCLTGCLAHRHVVGSGPTIQREKSKRQVYLLSLVPINEVDTDEMASGSGSYEIYTRANVLDYIITFLTSGLITTRKVTVTH